jgi:hypothetical protein
MGTSCRTVDTLLNKHGTKHLPFETVLNSDIYLRTPNRVIIFHSAKIECVSVNTKKKSYSIPFAYFQNVSDM